MVGKRAIIGWGLGGVALAVAVGLGATGGGVDRDPQLVVADLGDMQAGDASYASYDAAAMPQGAAPQDMPPQGAIPHGDAQQALMALAQIRRQQCQNGIQQACQGVQQIPGYEQQLARWGSACRSGDRQACGQYQNLAQRIFTAYSESAAVMRAGAEGMAQMNAWRGQMNANAAASMSNLQARGAAGQAAHDARQRPMRPRTGHGPMDRRAASAVTAASWTASTAARPWTAAGSRRAYPMARPDIPMAGAMWWRFPMAVRPRTAGVP